MNQCQKWGRNQGRMMSWESEGELINELHLAAADQAVWSKGDGFVRRAISESQATKLGRIAEILIDNGHDEPDGLTAEEMAKLSEEEIDRLDEERSQVLVILTKADWALLDEIYGKDNPLLGTDEPCAPTGYQGWEVDAGLDEAV